MIPADLDDGFTTEVSDGIYCRPMLWAERQEWKFLPDMDQRRALSTPPHCYGGGWKDHQIAVIQFVMGYAVVKEDQDFQDLSDSVQLHVKINPGLSLLDCSICTEYAVDHSTGEVQRGPDGNLKKIPPGIAVPCDTRQGCLKRHWMNPLGLSNSRWAKTWNHYWRTRGTAASRLANCPIYQRNKLLLDWIVDYGRDCRFDPFVSGGSGRGSSDVQAKGNAGQNCNREGCKGGDCTHRASSSRSCRRTARTSIRSADGTSAGSGIPGETVPVQLPYTGEPETC